MSGHGYTLDTFPSSKHCAQSVVQVSSEGGMTTEIFDAVELFMMDDTWVERKRVFESGTAKVFAEKFVATFNAGARAS